VRTCLQRPPNLVGSPFLCVWGHTILSWRILDAGTKQDILLVQPLSCPHSGSRVVNRPPVLGGMARFHLQYVICDGNVHPPLCALDRSDLPVCVIHYVKDSRTRRVTRIWRAVVGCGVCGMIDLMKL